MDKFKRNAAECSQNAAKAARSEDRQAWLELAEDWHRLAQGGEPARWVQVNDSARSSSGPVYWPHQSPA
jgi:hypothetical protein